MDWGVFVMLSYIWPIALVVLSNTLYQICAKSVPEGMNEVLQSYRNLNRSIINRSRKEDDSFDRTGKKKSKALNCWLKRGGGEDGYTAISDENAEILPKEGDSLAKSYEKTEILPNNRCKTAKCVIQSDQKGADQYERTAPDRQS